MRRLYPGKVEPVRIITPNASGWQAWTTPTARKAGLSAAVIAASGFVGPVAPPVSPSMAGWYQALNEPVRVKPGLNAAQQAPYTSNTLPAPKFQEDRWHYPWSEPVRVKPGLTAALQVPFTGSPLPFPSTSEDRWHQAWSEPVRVKLGLAAVQQAQPAFIFSPPPAPVTSEDRWHFPWSEPVRTRGLPTAQQVPFTGSPLPFVAPEDGWHQAWADPVRIKLGLTGAVQSQLTGSPLPFPSTSEDRWHQPWSEPIRLASRLYAHPQNGDVYAQAVTPLASFAEPLRRASQTYLYPNYFASNFRSALPTIVQGEFSVPVQYFTPWKTGDNSVSFIAVQQTQQETVTADKWIYAWSEPVRVKAGLSRQLQQFATQPAAIIPNTSEDRWHLPWSEPVRTKPGLNAGLQQAFTQSLQLQTIFVDRWFAEFSTPVRTLPGLAASRQQYLAFNPLPIPPPTAFQTPIAGAVPTSWDGPPPALLKVLYQAKTEPVFVFATTPPVTYDMWGYPWTEPVRVKLGLHAGQQQVIAQPINPVISIGWGYPWTEPVRIKPAVQTGIHQFTAQPISPVITIGWGYPFSEPVRIRPRLVESLQEFYTKPLQPIVQTFDRWGYPWTEPVRIKPGLRAAIQEFYTKPNTPILPIKPDMLGFNWSEPVRLKPGMAARLQQTIAQVFLTNIQITYSAQLRATETDLDRFLGLLYAWLAPINCYVDIIEKDPTIGGYGAIIENTQQSGIVASIIEPQSTPGGSIISPTAVAGARVAIITS